MHSQFSGSQFLFMFARVGPEALLVSAAVLISLLYPRLGSRVFQKAERVLVAVARRRRLSVLICGISALMVRLAVMPWLPIPKPFINDEFSFLLAGDTFAHGRLANPSPPMWIHLETFHTIFHPTYASMYPPLQGLMLALGQVVFGHPFWGMWLSAGIMCATICWMLQAWLPPTWALLGGVLLILRFGVFSYWDNGYWGGTLVATAGALVLGALPRTMRHQRVLDAVIMAIGIAMLANSRPYEGLMLCIVVAARLVWWILKFRLEADRPSYRTLLNKVALPMLVVLALAGGATSYYFRRVTGSPLKMPQQLNRETYAVARYFYWQTAYPEPNYRHKAIRDFYTQTELRYFALGKTLSGQMLQLATKLGTIWVFYFAPALTLPLFLLPRMLRDRRIRFLLIAGAFGFATSAVVVFFNIHYVAVLTSIMLALILQGMRHLRNWHFAGEPSGQLLVRAIVVICILMVPVQVRILGATPAPGSWAAIGPNRDAIDKRLESLPGPQLVLVRYSSDHDPLAEWVYNHADIDQQKVVWARDMNAAQNEELLQYFKDRHVWLLEPDQIPPKLVPYTDTTARTHLISKTNE